MVERIAPGSSVTDLGGCTSLNLRLQSAGLVLRAHQPYVSRERILALREIRRGLLDHGLRAAEPQTWQGKQTLRCRGRVAELESYVPHHRPEATWDSYRWMYRAMGELHRAFAALGASAPKPVSSTYAPPGSLRRWLPVTEAAVRHDPEAAGMVRLTRSLVRRLRQQWIPASALPNQFVHGDVRLGNVGRTSEGESVYLDFGFAAVRPRIHDLAYSLAWVVLRPDGTGTGENFDWDQVAELVAEYEAAACVRLTELERAALAPYTAAVPLYAPAIIGHGPNAAARLRDDRDGWAFLRISEWLLANPGAALGRAG